MEFVRLLVAGLAGFVVYWTTLTQGVPVALGTLGFISVMLLLTMERSIRGVARALDLNFDMLRHLQRKPNGEPFDS